MSLAGKLKTLFRGDIPLHLLPIEFVRRRNAAKRRRGERASLDVLNVQPARLLPEFEEKSQDELLDHFRTRESPSFWPAVPIVWEAEEVIREADRIAVDSAWKVMGFGAIRLEGENCWRRDPVNGRDWGLDHHVDTHLHHDDGSDVRVLWEVNRFGHAITLAQAYRATNDERYAATFFSHVESWIEQDPYGRGANWASPMEVALRATNLLAAFDIFRSSESLNGARLAMMLRLFDQHARFIADNIEFSHIATSNHYLSNVIGLFWVGTMLPEMEHADEWRSHGRSEMLREMDKQILPDGVDFEASTGYHRFVTEMFLLTFLLARQNGIDVDEKYWSKLRSMLEFVRDITRPDGRMPMIGDCDGSRFIPVTPVDANETTSLLRMGAEFITDLSTGSAGYPNAGIYILRDKDRYLALNASDCGLNGRGSHGHNDALSIEVSAFGVSFIVDPGSYVYNLDWGARHNFHSTAYHSTLTVDGEEQNTTDPATPFVLGNEAKPRVLEWSTSAARDVVSAEHYGYKRLRQPLTHRRIVTFHKARRAWVVDDDLYGIGEHHLQFAFHFAQGIDVEEKDGVVTARHGSVSAFIAVRPQLAFDKQPAFVSRNYGQREPSTIGVWKTRTKIPFKARFVMVPVGPDDRENERLELTRRLADNT